MFTAVDAVVALLIVVVAVHEPRSGTVRLPRVLGVLEVLLFRHELDGARDAHHAHCFFLTAREAATNNGKSLPAHVLIDALHRHLMPSSAIDGTAK